MWAIFLFKLLLCLFFSNAMTCIENVSMYIELSVFKQIYYHYLLRKYCSHKNHYIELQHHRYRIAKNDWKEQYYNDNTRTTKEEKLETNSRKDDNIRRSERVSIPCFTWSNHRKRMRCLGLWFCKSLCYMIAIFNNHLPNVLWSILFAFTGED